MRKQGKPHPDSRLHVLCPFCGFSNSKSNPFKWCAGCYVEYEISTRGNLWFDTSLKREEYFLAKAIAKSGGARIGNIQVSEQK